MGGESYFFIHIFGGFLKPPKIWTFFQINRTGRKIIFSHCQREKMNKKFIL